MARKIDRTVVTIVDVAAKAGVSTATASRALGGYGRVSQATTERVRAAAAELGYQPNALAQSMIRGTTRTIGVVVADIENPFFARAARGIGDVARAAGYEVLLVNTDENLQTEVKATEVLAQKRVDGIIIAPADTREFAHLSRARRAGLGVVLLDRRIPGFDASVVRVDNVVAGRTAVQHLLELGHRKIGLLTGVPHQHVRNDALRASGSSSPALDRLIGYYEAFRDVGVQLRAHYVKTGGTDRAWGASATHQLLSLSEPPTAMVASDAIIALGMIDAVRRAPFVVVPEHLSLISIDEPDWAEVVDPTLTVVAQPDYEMGAEAARILLDQLSHSGPFPIVDRVLETVLKVRLSTSSVAVPSTS
ncbi:LacI family DNA-binding transcriptional regulator [Arthrobacter sedimenti]|uniref:LacI family DNA-binding transcriptional regulator n=1 Tax=Arthrobacter sedimenti TaxID=2694931 RepID=UPI0014247C1B|nr:LacI family DNA-binding transcriptional regulator [Arthrobacter sedimenti]